MNNFEANFGFSDQQMGFNFLMTENPVNSPSDFVVPKLEGADNYGETSPIGQSWGSPIVVPQAHVSEFQHGSSSGWADSLFPNTMLDMERNRREAEERRIQESRILQEMEQRFTHTLMLKNSQIENLIQLNLGLRANLENLYFDNQIWRNIAQREAEALNSYLEAQTGLESTLDDAESLWGSSVGDKTGLESTLDDAQSLWGSSVGDNGEQK